jgi:hypothetical protein
MYTRIGTAPPGPGKVRSTTFATASGVVGLPCDSSNARTASAGEGCLRASSGDKVSIGFSAELRELIEHGLHLCVRRRRSRCWRLGDGRRRGRRGRRLLLVLRLVAVAGVEQENRRDGDNQVADVAWDAPCRAGRRPADDSEAIIAVAWRHPILICCVRANKNNQGRLAAALVALIDLASPRGFEPRSLP